MKNGTLGTVTEVSKDAMRVVLDGAERRKVSFAFKDYAALDYGYAATVHKAQGSQFDTVAVLLPGPDSPILTRELLYTAVTRAQRRLFVAGTEDSLRSAVSRPIARASGLRQALWGGAGGRGAPA